MKSCNNVPQKEIAGGPKNRNIEITRRRGFHYYACQCEQQCLRHRHSTVLQRSQPGGNHLAITWLSGNPYASKRQHCHQWNFYVYRITATCKRRVLSIWGSNLQQPLSSMGRYPQHTSRITPSGDNYSSHSKKVKVPRPLDHATTQSIF